MEYAKQVQPSGYYSNEWLEKMRQIGDPMADRLMLFFKEQNIPPEQWLKTIEVQVNKKQPDFIEFYDQVTHVPEWAKKEDLQLGKQAGLRYSILSGLALLGGSLLESYSASKGAKVLIATGRLKKDVLLRLFETAQFCYEIVKSQGPFPGEPAWRLVIFIRLLHASVRYDLLRKGWNLEYGYPVNQEDYAGTLLMFSYVFRRALKKLGVELTLQEESSMHLQWRYVGYLLGVHPDLLTKNLSEEVELYRTISARQCNPDEDSKTLAHALVNAVDGSKPFYLPKEALYELARIMIGNDLANAYQFPRSTFWATFWQSATLPNRFLSSLSLKVDSLDYIFQTGGDWITQQIIHAGLQGHSFLQRASA
ncbi:MAG: DUF2236 domain-containing protein [Candidatus Hydrogenedentota bacterium]|nr:MAG: DUF2236 domain-containing protein [Candidatus Hydrogenedentota bacterium]